MQGWLLATCWAASLAVAFHAGRKDQQETYRRDGSERQPASTDTKSASEPTPTPTLGRAAGMTETTRTAAAGYSSSPPRGSQSEAAAILRTRLGSNSYDEPDESGFGTRVAGESGAPRASAGSHDPTEYCECGAHTKGTPCYFGLTGAGDEA